MRTSRNPEQYGVAGLCPVADIAFAIMRSYGGSIILPSKLDGVAYVTSTAVRLRDPFQAVSLTDIAGTVVHFSNTHHHPLSL
jgi:hypothetical protein